MSDTTMSAKKSNDLKSVVAYAQELYDSLKENGFSDRNILKISGELIGMVTNQIQMVEQRSDH